MRTIVLMSVVLATLLMPATLPAARIYIWTDAEGVKHFSQEPPPEDATEVMVKDEIRYDPSADAKQHNADTELEPLAPRSSRPRKSPRQQQTKIVVKNNVILVPTTLTYSGRQVDAQLVLDTGASSTVLHAPLASRLGVRPEVNAKIRVASGDVIDAQAVVMDTVSVGPHSQQGMRTLIIRHQGPQTSHEGLLGLNALSQYPYSIDMQNMVINWGTQIPPMGP